MATKKQCMLTKTITCNSDAYFWGKKSSIKLWKTSGGAYLSETLTLFLIPNFISGECSSISLTLKQAKWRWILITWDCCFWLQCMQHNKTLKPAWEKTNTNCGAILLVRMMHRLRWLPSSLTDTESRSHLKRPGILFSYATLFQSDNFMEYNQFTKFGALECRIDYSFFSQRIVYRSGVGTSHGDSMSILRSIVASLPLAFALH